ncbi:MAG: hypothetical protein KC619_17440 [Myxococcales bacterium]|nr:hypothetical protein [Myxococcales bacterium]
MSDWISTISSGLSWLVVLAELAAAVAAVVRLRVTASGVLIALGFGGLALSNLFSRLVWMLWFRPALQSGDFTGVETLITGLSLLTAFLAMVFWVLIGIGAVLVPSALKRG